MTVTLTEETYRLLPIKVGSRSIRLLELEALSKPESKSTPLCGRLRVVRLIDNPKFTALSYVWGSRIKTITINGCNLEITENCFDALIALRAQYGALTIWVDAICVNQKNKDEKSDQIPLMEEIYTWAQTVYIWFGKGSEQSYAAMDCFSKVPKSYQCLYSAHLAASPNYLYRFFAFLPALFRTLYYQLIWFDRSKSSGIFKPGKPLLLIKRKK
jgi:hypothetical protein